MFADKEAFKDGCTITKQQTTVDVVYQLMRHIHLINRVKHSQELHNDNSGTNINSILIKKHYINVMERPVCTIKVHMNS